MRDHRVALTVLGLGGGSGTYLTYRTTDGRIEYLLNPSGERIP
jgi:hypothetical protein